MLWNNGDASSEPQGRLAVGPRQHQSRPRGDQAAAADHVLITMAVLAACSGSTIKNPKTLPALGLCLYFGNLVVYAQTLKPDAGKGQQ